MNIELDNLRTQDKFMRTISAIIILLVCIVIPYKVYAILPSPVQVLADAGKVIPMWIDYIYFILLIWIGLTGIYLSYKTLMNNPIQSQEEAKLRATGGRR